MIPYSLNPMGIDSTLTDLDILRQIRDDNPTSQLPTLWSEDKDPYTQWEGVVFDTNLNVISVDVISRGVVSLDKVNKLPELSTLLCTDNNIALLDLSFTHKLVTLHCYYNAIRILNVDGCVILKYMLISYNRLESIPTLTSKGSIITADFTHNLMPTTETNRIIALGFTSAQVLPQDI